MNGLEILEQIKEWWAFIAGAGAAIWFGYVRYRKYKNSSLNDLYTELERIKKAIIRQSADLVDKADTISDLKIILSRLRSHCPDCYEDFVKNHKGVIDKLESKSGA